MQAFRVNSMMIIPVENYEDWHFQVLVAGEDFANIAMPLSSKLGKQSNSLVPKPFFWVARLR